MAHPRSKPSLFQSPHAALWRRQQYLETDPIGPRRTTSTSDRAKGTWKYCWPSLPLWISGDSIRWLISGTSSDKATQFSPLTGRKYDSPVQKWTRQIIAIYDACIPGRLPGYELQVKSGEENPMVGELADEAEGNGLGVEWSWSRLFSLIACISTCKANSIERSLLLCQTLCSPLSLDVGVNNVAPSTFYSSGEYMASRLSLPSLYLNLLRSRRNSGRKE